MKFHSVRTTDMLRRAMRMLARVTRPDDTRSNASYQSSVLGSIDYQHREYSNPDFDVLVEWYRRDSYVKFAVDSIVARIGTRYYLVGEDRELLRLVDSFLRRNRFTETHLKVARDVVLSGNAFLNLVPRGRINTIHYVPLSSIRSIVRAPEGKALKYVQSWQGKVIELGADEVWHFRFNPINEEAFGEGLVNHLARPGVGYSIRGKTVRRPSLLEIKERIDNAARILVEKYPQRSVFVVPRTARDSFKEAYEQAMVGQDLVVDFDLKQLEVKVDSKTRFYELIEHLDRQVVTGLRNPLIRLITYTGFTYASAQAAIETLEPEVALLRDFLSSQYEEIIGLVLRQHGIDPGTSSVRMMFGEPQAPSWDVNDVIAAARGDERNPPIISVEEAREMLRLAGWRLQGDSGGSPTRTYCLSGGVLREQRW
ncbi:MAG: phage portal protein [Thaumarchaeota archaeon]|nr:phage portal protein [Candidatus Calditenuaceae archaeon]MDW8187617.1 hypothetical protein [Nitrososphaerota archaeon]